MVSKGQFVGLNWNRITRLHSQVMIGTQEVKNSLTASRCHLKAYPRCGQPTSKVSILKMKQQQHDINLRRTRKSFKERLFGKRKKVILKSPRIDSISGALLHVCAV